MIANLFNITLVIAFVMYIVRFIKKTKTFSIILALHILFSVWQICSVAFIESGVYNVDLLTDSYFNFSTLRLLIYELLFFEVMLFWYKRSKLDDATSIYAGTRFFREKYHQIILMVAVAYVGYEILNMLVSENSLSNSSVTRFNFYMSYSVLPFAQTLSYFTQPMVLMLGCVYSNCRKKWRKRLSVVLLLGMIVACYGTGNEFGVLLYLIIYFFTPTVIKAFGSISWQTTKQWFSTVFSKNKKIIYAGIAFLLFASCIKIMSFTKVNVYSEYVSSPIAAFFYRALALQGDVWWAVDTKVLGGYNGIAQLGVELLGLFGDDGAQNTGIYYLMRLIMPESRFNNYIWGNATLTAGYPAIDIAIFGYIGAIFVVVLEASFFFWFAKYVYMKLIKRQYLRLFMSFFVYLQVMKVYNISGYSSIANLIPIIFILLLLIVETIASINRKKQLM